MTKTLRVLDSSGDTVVEFDAAQADAKATGEAKALFDRLTQGGSAVFAVNRASGAPDQKVTSFDSLEEQNIVVKPLVGG